MNNYRMRFGDAWVLADKLGDGRWRVTVAGECFRPIDVDQKKQAIKDAVNDLSDLRAWLWHEELGMPRKAAKKG